METYYNIYVSISSGETLPVLLNAPSFTQVKYASKALHLSEYQVVMFLKRCAEATSYPYMEIHGENVICGEISNYNLG
jgi:hypothetical protein